MTKTQLLLATTFLASSLIVSPVFAQATANTRVVSETSTRTVKPLAVNSQTNEVKPAVQRFVELVNQARVDLAMKRPQDAKPRIDNALKMAQFIRQNSNVEEMYRETRISSGRVTYNSNDSSGTYYVPFETGPVKVKSLVNTPSSKSGNSGVAVTGADVVYLKVDLSGPEAEKYLNQAKAAIKQGDIKNADKNLSDLMDAVASTETAEVMPYEKASDNLALALRFLQDNNYSAAQYALDHAVEAIGSMKTDSRYDAGLVDKNHSRLKQIHDLVMQQTPASAQKARTQIIAAQDEIKALKS